MTAWLRVDKMFASVSIIVQRMLSLVAESKGNTSGVVVVTKFFGMGSIIRFLSLCKQRGVDLSKVLILTFESNREVCELWGVRGIFINSRSIGAMISGV